MSTRAEWPLSEVAAQRINTLRKQAGMNRKELAERCRQYGAPPTLTEAAVANIETGRPDSTGRRRRELTVEEIVIFARALNVAPLMLMFPVGTFDEVELLPGEVRPTFLAARWFAGDSAFPDVRYVDGWRASEDSMQAWHQSNRGYHLLLSHEVLLAEWKAAGDWGLDRDSPNYLGRLRDNLRAIRLEGLPRPWVPKDLAELLDDDDAPKGGGD